MQKCDDPRCPVCYPKRKKEEAAARKQATDDKQDCIDCWRFYQKKAEAIVSVDDPVARNRRINAAYAQLWWTITGSSGRDSLHLHPNRSAAACSMPQR